MQKYFLHTKIKCVKYKHLDKKYKKTLAIYFTFYYNIKIFYHKES